MRELDLIVKTYDEWIARRLKSALVSVVDVDGSSYRRVGARMLINELGEWVGGVSGGCLEGDALIKAKKAIFKQTSVIVTYDTREEDSHQIGVGLGCNGLIKILITPLQASDKYHPIEMLRQVKDSRKKVSLYHFINPENHPLFGRLMTGSALRKFQEFKSVNELINIDKAIGVKKIISVESTDYGAIKVAKEVLLPKFRVFLIGHHQDTISMAKQCLLMDWDVHIFGRRRKMAKEIFNLSISINEYEAIANAKSDGYTAAVFMTHDLNKDIMLSRLIGITSFGYVGYMGPTHRMDKIKDALSEINVHLSDYQHVYAPIGLDIGGQLPKEIHTSIIAEIIAVFHSRNGGHLKYRKGPIN